MLNAQVKVLGKIEPNGPTDTYPTHVDSLGRGGFVAVKTWQERNSIPLQRRKAGMMVSVKSATVDSLYRLGIGLTNADWLPYVASVDVSDKASLTMDNHFQGIQNFDSGAYSVAGFWTDGNFEAEGNLQTKTGVFLSTDYVSANSWASITIDPALPPNTNIDIKMPLSSGRLALTSDLSSKANLTGGNIFNGNQLFNHRIDAGGGLFTNQGVSIIALRGDATDIVNLSDLNYALETFDGAEKYGKLSLTREVYSNSNNDTYLIKSNFIPPQNIENETLSYDIHLPNKSGSLALLSDIPAPADISGKEDKANKATSLASSSNTTYPTTQAVTNKLYEYGKLTATNMWGLLDSSPWGWEPIPAVTNIFTNGIKVGLDVDYLTDGFIDFTESGGANSVRLQSTAGTESGVVYKLPAKTTGTYDLATTSDIPKMFTYTSIEHTDRNEIEYNLGFTPTMAMAVINSDVAQNIVISSVQISSSIITVQTSASLPAGTKFTIMVK